MDLRAIQIEILSSNGGFATAAAVDLLTGGTGSPINKGAKMLVEPPYIAPEESNGEIIERGDEESGESRQARTTRTRTESEARLTARSRPSGTPLIRRTTRTPRSSRTTSLLTLSPLNSPSRRKFPDSSLFRVLEAMRANSRSLKSIRQ